MRGESGLGDARRSRVLIVDDEECILRTFQRILEPLYDVVTFTCPARALESLRAGDRFDAIISDVRMPTMTGPALHHAIREARPQLANRIVFVTATPPDGCTLCGAPVLAKPVKRVELLEAVARLVDVSCTTISRPTPVRSERSSS